ncbi:MAG: hypothetical protein ACOC4J_00060 [Bacteroidota bacterium]
MSIKVVAIPVNHVMVVVIVKDLTFTHFSFKIKLFLRKAFKAAVVQW